MEVTWHWKHFNALTPQEVHDILQLRCSVFVVEQRCSYQDVDGLDPSAVHLLGTRIDPSTGTPRLVAYLRSFIDNEDPHQASFGRFVVESGSRGGGIGHAMIRAEIARLHSRGVTKIQIEAQAYLEHFYRSHGFKPISEQFLDEGVPHITMLWTLDQNT